MSSHFGSYVNWAGDTTTRAAFTLVVAWENRDPTRLSLDVEENVSGYEVARRLVQKWNESPDTPSGTVAMLSTSLLMDGGIMSLLDREHSHVNSMRFRFPSAKEEFKLPSLSGGALAFLGIGDKLEDKGNLQGLEVRRVKPGSVSPVYELEA